MRELFGLRKWGISRRVVHLFWFILFAAGCGSYTTPPEADYNPERDYTETRQASDQAVDFEERGRIWREFLDRNPQNQYTIVAVEYLAVQHLAKDRNDPVAAVDLVRNWLSKTEEPRARRRLEGILVDVLGDAGDIEGLREIRASWSKDRPLTMADRERFTQASLKAGDWVTASEDAGVLVESASRESISQRLGAASNPAEILEQMKIERAPALMNFGWALSNLGQVEAALEALEEAAELGQFNFAGCADWPTENLDYYLAKTYFAAGRRREALERVLPLAVISRSAQGLGLLQEIFEAEGGKIAEFPEYVSESRLKVARTMPDFTAFDYRGQPVTFGEVKGEVTLLAFWFPT